LRRKKRDVWVAGGEKQILKKNIFLNISGVFCYFFFQWLISVLVVRIAGFREAGVYSLSFSFANIFLIIANFGVIRYQLSDIQRKYTDGVYFATRAVTCLAALLLGVLTLFFTGFTPYTVMCCAAMLCFKLLESITDVFFGALQRFDRFGAINLSYILKGVFPVAAFCVALYYKNLFFATVALSVVYALVVALFDIPAVIRDKNLASAVAFKDIPRVLFACFPLALVTVVYPYMAFITRYTVNQLYSAEELGYYSSVTLLIAVMITLGNSVWNALIPHMAERYHGKEYGLLKKTIAKIIGIVMLAGAFLVLAGLVFGEWVLALVFGEKIRPYCYLLTPTFIVSTIWTLVSFFNASLTAFEKRTPPLVCNMAGVVVCTALIRPFVQAYGMIGSCYCLIVSMGLQAVLSLIYLSTMICPHRRSR
jgi:O-antigen/teichoic acid export membrane protein